MQIIDAEMKNNRTEEHSEYTNGEEDNHSPHRVVSDLKIVLAIQQKTAQDTCGTTDDIGHNIMDRDPLCETCKNQEIERCCTTPNNSVQDEVPEFSV